MAMSKFEMVGWGVYAAFAVAVIGGTDYYSTLTKTDLDNDTRDAARVGAVTPDQVCKEHEKFSENLDVYFKAKAEGEAVNPTLTITKADCMEIMAKKAAVPAPGQ